jgi:hypothetical protein
MLATLSPNHDVDVVVNAWLPAAARRLVVDLIYCNVVPKSADATAGDDEEEEVEEAGRRGLVELPCFDNATMIHLKLRYQGLAFPPQGIFDKLTILSQSRVRFHAPATSATLSPNLGARPCRSSASSNPTGWTISTSTPSLS